MPGLCHAVSDAQDSHTNFIISLPQQRCSARVCLTTFQQLSDFWAAPRSVNKAPRCMGGGSSYRNRNLHFPPGSLNLIAKTKF
jgi:hypothetical protein